MTDYEKLCYDLRYNANDWNGDGYIKRNLFDAADAIVQLQVEKDFANHKADALMKTAKKLQDEIERLKKELDAAVEDMKELAEDTDSPFVCEMCSRVVSCPTRDGKPCDFQWIGERTEQGDEDGKNG